MPQNKPDSKQTVQPLESSKTAPHQSQDQSQDQPEHPSEEVENLRKQLEESNAALAKAEAEAVAAKNEVQEVLTAADEAVKEAQAAAEEHKPKVAPVPGVVDQETMKTKDGQELCWNCFHHDKKTVLNNGVCEECGFDKDKLYNGNIEAEKASQRMVDQQL